MQFYGFDGETHATSEELASALEFAGTNAELPTAYGGPVASKRVLRCPQAGRVFIASVRPPGFFHLAAIRAEPAADLKTL
jgi:hypothetical protein